MAEAMDTTTEQYAVNWENNNNLWYEQYTDLETKYLQLIDHLLAIGTKEAHTELLSFFSNEQNITPFQYRSNPIIEMIGIMDIYRSELLAGETHTILNITTIENQPLSRPELIELVRALRFLLWRIDFAEDKNAEDEIITFINTHGVSPAFLCYAIECITENKLNMLNKLISLTLNHGMVQHALKLLDDLNKFIPGNAAIQKLLSEVQNIQKDTMNTNE